MRRGAVVLMTLFLVNLPFVHETYTDREVRSSGRDVEATLLDARTVDGRHFVDYRLPRSLDPAGTRYSARVDGPTYERARESKVLQVRVVPGKPAANRPAGQVGNRLFAVVAISADLMLLLVGVLLWRRWRRWSLHEVVGVADGPDGHDRVVTIASRGQTITVAGPPGWADGVQPGDRVAGSVHLVAEDGVLPGRPLSGLEQVHGSSYVVRGRVVDARAGRVELELDGGFRLRVETGQHRIRADIRDSSEVRGTLCFTPAGGRG